MICISWALAVFVNLGDSIWWMNTLPDLHQRDRASLVMIPRPSVLHCTAWSNGYPMLAPDYSKAAEVIYGGGK